MMEPKEVDVASTQRDDFPSKQRNLAKKAKTLLNLTICGFFSVMWGLQCFIPKNDCYTLPGENCNSSDQSIRVNCESIDINDPKYADLEEKPFNVTIFWNFACWFCFILYTLNALGSFGHISPDSKFGSAMLKMDDYTHNLQYVAFVYIHLVRFSHSGMVCSGAYIEHDTTDMSGYMI